MKSLDSHTLKKFLQLACKRLNGSWVLLGGTLLPALGRDIRATVDIDFVGLGSEERSSQLELMEISEQLGLSIETVNQAASHFLNKVKYTKDDLLPLLASKNCKIFRPSLSLYWKLKINRLSETDVLDCIEYLDYCLVQSDPINFEEIQKHIRIKKVDTSKSKAKRLDQLQKALSDYR